MATCKRKADRVRMSANIAALAIQQGARATIKTPESGDCLCGPREIRVAIEAARGLRVSVEFDGDARDCDSFLLSWHMSIDSDACLSDGFAPFAVNPFHFRKATHIARGFEDLRDLLARTLAMARDGSAFDAAREAAQIAKHGTAAERNARFASYRAERASANGGAPCSA